MKKVLFCLLGGLCLLGITGCGFDKSNPIIFETEANDEQDEIYTFKNYSEEEWLINLLDTGATKECMLYKEKNVTNIPEGLSSEYEWNN